MIEPETYVLSYNWQKDIEPHLNTMSTVEGGFTPAKRGVVELADGTSVFVKIATGPLTRKWLKKEIKVYLKLNAAGYEFIPKLLSCNDDHTAMAIAYLDGASFENIWDEDKLNAVLKAQTALKAYKALFLKDPDFKSDDIVTHGSKWPAILEGNNLELINKKLLKLGSTVTFDRRYIEELAQRQAGWSMNEDTLIHEDIRADNFGYNPITKEGMLIDWNWLCIGDESLDVTPLFINMYISGFDPYKLHPEKYDPQMIMYLMSFWLEAILHGEESSSDREWKLRAAQAKNVVVCNELLMNSYSV